MKRIETDFVVVGSGIAGLMTALRLASEGEVIILTKAEEQSCNSFRAQGGIAAAIGEGDSPELHREDTLRTGAGLCDAEAVDTLVRAAPEVIRLLSEWGTPFDRDGDKWALGREGSHSAARILHASGDATGAAVMRTLLARVRSHPRICMYTHTFAGDLIVDRGECAGVTAVDAKGEAMACFARGVLLATGGCGQLYRYTTNDLVATGDGFAMAFRAGVMLVDMEFVQFHPTTLAVKQNPMVLISEAVRGEGAVLVNERGEPFAKRYHPWGDLAPRDEVSRAIFREMAEGHRVFLDATRIGNRFSRRFPTIDRQCKEFGIDPSRDPIPVTPAAHFIMGGIRTDSSGRTNLPRLFACGEVACTGVHGANRLASNSLLEGAVFSQRVAEKMVALPSRRSIVEKITRPVLLKDKQKREEWKDRIRRIMWDGAGIFRTAEGLLQAIRELRELEESVLKSDWEIQNMITTAQAIVHSALWRRESRGAHYRADYPTARRDWAKKRSILMPGRCADESVTVAIDHS